MNSRGRIQYKPVPPSGGAGTLTVTSTLVTVPPRTTLIEGTSESPGHLEEQDALEVENYMGENGLATEEEYKWGHYNCGAYELSPSPPVPASHLMIPRRIHSLLDVLVKPLILCLNSPRPGVHLDERYDRP